MACMSIHKPQRRLVISGTARDKPRPSSQTALAYSCTTCRILVPCYSECYPRRQPDYCRHPHEETTFSCMPSKCWEITGLGKMYVCRRRVLQYPSNDSLYLTRQGYSAHREVATIPDNHWPRKHCNFKHNPFWIPPESLLLGICTWIHPCPNFCRCFQAHNFIEQESRVFTGAYSNSMLDGQSSRAAITIGGNTPCHWTQR